MPPAKARPEASSSARSEPGGIYECRVGDDDGTGLGFRFGNGRSRGELFGFLNYKASLVEALPRRTAPPNKRSRFEDCSA